MLKSFYLLLIFVAISLHYVNSYNVDILMPNVSPLVEDSYLCHKFKIDTENPIYITEFLPNAKKETAHHILMFGCNEPGLDEEVWNCGEMQSSGGDNKYKSGSVCQGGGQSIIYAWAMDAPKLKLPNDVAFKVGPGTNAKYIVLQVHYANVDKFRNGETDASGVRLVAQDEPVPNRAGVWLFATGGYIKPGTEEHFEAACEVRNDIVLHPFAFRTHSHKLGLVTSGYRVRYDKGTGEQEWIEIGRRSPQLPQMFYPTTNNVPIRKGDVIAARCTMKNFVDHDVSIGATGEDEMCNFYMMYYVEGDKILENNYCTTSGPPYWYFSDFKTVDGKKLDLKLIPKTISEIPESNEKPVNHNNHKQMEHKMENESNENNNKNKVEINESEDEDVEYLTRLEEDLVIRKFLNKYLHQN